MLAVAGLAAGLACSGFGIGLVVMGASSPTDLTEVVGAVLGAWMAFFGMGLLLASARRLRTVWSGGPRTSGRHALPDRLLLAQRPKEAPDPGLVPGGRDAGEGSRVAS